MLTQLSIQNILLIKSCEIPFASGLNVLTGETGAGKSILLDALGLVLGERGDAGLVRAGAENASAAAEFEVSGHEAIQALLREVGIEESGLLVMRRTLSAEGKSRAFVNDMPVSVSTLKRFGEMLIARHGQHDQRGLMDVRTHRNVLDQVGNHRAALAQVAEAYRSYRQAQEALRTLEEQAATASREDEWLRATVQDLTQLSPQEGEEELLAEIRKKASEVKASSGALNEALALLTESQGVALQLRTVSRLLGKTPRVDAAWLEGIERAETEVELVSVGIEGLLRDTEIDPHMLEQAEDRLHALRAASRKYNVAVAVLPEYLEESARKLDALVNLDVNKQMAEKACIEAEKAYRSSSAALHDIRAKTGKALSDAVMKELKPLKMQSTQLRVVQTELPQQSWGEEGMHQVQFEVATNAGMPFGPLAKVASGGELSRLLLAMKVYLRTNDEITAIFDEIDSGTGGAIAEAIGLRLKKLATEGQVIVVTHLPQVAALAAHHLFIEKSGVKEVITRVNVLNVKERKEELARMLSGATISDEARRTAAKLLEGAA